MNKRTFVVCSVFSFLISVIVVSVLLLYTYIYNKQVERYAHECGDKLCELSINFADNTINEEEVKYKFKKLSQIIQDNEFDKNKLIYFDGSEIVYNLIKDKSDYLLFQYNIYIKKNFSVKT